MAVKRSKPTARLITSDDGGCASPGCRQPGRHQGWCAGHWGENRVATGDVKSRPATDDVKGVH